MASITQDLKASFQVPENGLWLPRWAAVAAAPHMENLNAPDFSGIRPLGRKLASLCCGTFVMLKTWEGCRVWKSGIYFIWLQPSPLL